MFLKISLHRTKYQHLLPVSNYLQLIIKINSIFLFLVTISVGEYSGEALQLNLLEGKFILKNLNESVLIRKENPPKISEINERGRLFDTEEYLKSDFCFKFPYHIQSICPHGQGERGQQMWPGGRGVKYY